MRKDNTFVIGTVDEALDFIKTFDGEGLVITDEYEIENTLNNMGLRHQPPELKTAKQAGWHHVCKMNQKGHHVFVKMTGTRFELAIFVNSGSPKISLLRCEQTTEWRHFRYRWGSGTVMYKKEFTLEDFYENVGLTQAEFFLVRDEVQQLVSRLVENHIISEYGHLSKFDDRIDRDFDISLFEYGIVRDPETGITLFWDEINMTLCAETIILDDVEFALDLTDHSYWKTQGLEREKSLEELDNNYLAHHISSLRGEGLI